MVVPIRAISTPKISRHPDIKAQDTSRWRPSCQEPHTPFMRTYEESPHGRNGTVAKDEVLK